MISLQRRHVSRIFVLATVLASLAFAPALASSGTGHQLLSSAVGAETVTDVPNVRFRDRGLAPSSMPISVVVTLAYHHPLQLEQLIRLQNDPSSPYFRHWLTSEQFALAFAPTQAEYARVGAALERAGFRITQTYSNRTVLDAHATAAIVERYFSTKIDRVDQPGHGLRYANVRPALIPAELRGLVFVVAGLNDLSIVHPDYVLSPHRHRASTIQANVAAPVFGPGGAATDGYGPLVFERSYDFPTLHRNGAGYYDGTGRSAAIVNDADYKDGDVAAYLKYFQIKRTGQMIRVSVDDGVHLNHLYPTSDSLETTLDVETLAANAPGATIYVYETPTWQVGTFPIADAYNTIVSQNKVDTVNSSFGQCETGDPSETKAWDHIAAQGAALGITFHAASGDTGSYSGNTCSAGPSGSELLQGVESPASSPHVVAVGGTSLAVFNANGEYLKELGWGGDGEGSGGGVSSIFSMPSWQTGVKNTQPKGRNVPDVAFDGDPGTGSAIYYSGPPPPTWINCGTGWNSCVDPIGGTSLASPLFGAALVEIDEIIGGRSGLAAQTLFDFWKKDGYALKDSRLFHDVTVGTNGAYNCLVGYDNVTGIGSLDVWNVAQALKH